MPKLHTWGDNGHKAIDYLKLEKSFLLCEIDMMPSFGFNLRALNIHLKIAQIDYTLADMGVI